MVKSIVILIIGLLSIVMVSCEKIEGDVGVGQRCVACPEQKECQECKLCEECAECETCSQSQIPVGKAILDVTTYDWAINEINDDEIFFDYWLMNYGDTEARNVKVRCKLKDDAGSTVINTVDSFGNIASYSAQLAEVITQKTSKVTPNNEYSGNCYVDSCTNCIILYKRIPDFIEGYEG